MTNGQKIAPINLVKPALPSKRKIAGWRETVNRGYQKLNYFHREAKMLRIKTTRAKTARTRTSRKPIVRKEQHRKKQPEKR